MTIQATQEQLGKILTPLNYQFEIPGYQRPYAWQKDQVLELLDDLFNAFPYDQEDDADYFLGSIILIKELGQEKAEVIDDQQRLTTLTLLMAIIRHLLPPDNLAYRDIGDRLEKLNLSGGSSLGLKVRDEDEPFFASKVRQAGGIEALLAMTAGLETDSQRLLRDNAKLLIKEITKRCPEEVNLHDWLVDFYQQILNKCYLVVVSTTDFETAYRIFSTINTRGLNLEINDILKAEIIGAIENQKNKQSYTKTWDLEEQDLGRDDFRNLFTYMQRIIQREKPKGSLLKEYRTKIKPQARPLEFIDQTLKPYSDALEIIRDGNFKADNKKLEDKINTLFNWLSRIDNSDWLPPAIHFQAKYHENAEQTLAFFTNLERLAAGMMVLRVNINHRLERYFSLLTAIDQGPISAINKAKELITPEEQQEIIAVLDGDIYTMSRIRLYILLRLDSALADGRYSPSLDAKLTTIEHVLPQTLSDSWRTGEWTEELQQRWVHRLGNLALLSCRKNSAASNYSFRKKVNVYFLGNEDDTEESPKDKDKNKSEKVSERDESKDKDTVATFPLTTRIVAMERQGKNWTPDIVENNQKQFLNKLKKLWQLSSTL